MKKWILPMLFLVAMGCWSSEPEQTQSGGGDTDTLSPPMSPTMWTWPSDSGQPRDLAQDHADCMQLAEGQKSTSRRIGVLWDCMRQKGWYRMKGTHLKLEAEALKAQAE